MSHWAQLDENNIVIQITVGDNNEIDEGYQWLIDNLGGRWIKTSYNKNIRKNFAGIGYYYDEINDIFLPPKPFPSWTINQNTLSWEAPISYPGIINTDPTVINMEYIWDEPTLSWIKFVSSI
jgi:hypothetical protein